MTTSPYFFLVARPFPDVPRVELTTHLSHSSPSPKGPQSVHVLTVHRRAAASVRSAGGVAARTRAHHVPARPGFAAASRCGDGGADAHVRRLQVEPHGDLRAGLGARANDQVEWVVLGDEGGWAMVKAKRQLGGRGLDATGEGDRPGK